MGDAADRLIIDESATHRDGLRRREIVVIGDVAGGLTLEAARAGSATGAVRVHQDSGVGTHAIADAAAAAGLGDAIATGPLDATLLADARVVLLRLPRTLRALDDIAGSIAAHASRDVTVVAGGRIKHMTVAMNDVLRAHFGVLDISHARQKSRVLLAAAPGPGGDPAPRFARHTVQVGARSHDVVVAAFGGVFADTSVDIGTRLLLEALPERIDADVVVDLACGSGVIGATLASRQPGLRVLASDDSAVAVASARATASANDVADRMTVRQDDGLSLVAPASVSFVTLNPPFHRGAAIDETLAPHLFAHGARALRPGGELWAVWNTPLAYRGALERIVGPTRQIARDPKFTVTASTRR